MPPPPQTAPNNYVRSNKHWIQTMRLNTMHASVELYIWPHSSTVQVCFYFGDLHELNSGTSTNHCAAEIQNHGLELKSKRRCLRDHVYRSLIEASVGGTNSFRVTSSPWTTSQKPNLPPPSLLRVKRVPPSLTASASSMSPIPVFHTLHFCK